MMPRGAPCQCHQPPRQWGYPPPPPPPIQWGPLLRVVGVLLILALALYGWKLVPEAGRRRAEVCHSAVVKAQPDGALRDWLCPVPARPKAAG
jgi:hypothetical protein